MIDPGTAFFLGNVLGTVIQSLVKVLYETPETLDVSRQTLTLDRERLEWEKRHALETAVAQRAGEERRRIERLEEIYQSAEINFILANWPLKLAPSIMQRSQTRQAPYVLLSTPAHLPMRKTIEEHVREFLDRHYPFQGSVRPVEFLGDVWESSKIRGAEGVKQLAAILTTEPSLLIEVDDVDGVLKVRLGVWGNGVPEYVYRTAATLPSTSTADAAATAKLLAATVCLLAGVFSDDYYRRTTHVPPQLPMALSSLANGDLSISLLVPLVRDAYVAMYRHFVEQQPLFEPETMAELSSVLRSLGDTAAARDAAHASVRRWTELRGHVVADVRKAVDCVAQTATLHDAPYVRMLRDALQTDERAAAATLTDLLATWPDSAATRVAAPVPPQNAVVSDAIWNPKRRSSEPTPPPARRRKNPFS